jgi:lipopolysaccharide transport system ATP-binding protein
MLKKLSEKIESKRHSKNLFWRFCVFIKDTLWIVIFSMQICLIKSKSIINPTPKRGKIPDFLLIGTQKGGTTSLWHHLKQHPKIEMSPNFVKFDGNKIRYKEIHFFDNDYIWAKGIRWYKSLFNDNSKLQGEATPEYIALEKNHKRMHKVVPNAKLILILREPTSRAYSSFNHQKKEGVYWDNLTKDIQFDKLVNKFIKSPGLSNNIIKRGFYIEQINSLLQYFRRENLLILISEEMRKNPQKVYNKIFDFLGIKRIKIKYKSSIHERTYDEPIKEGTKKRLDKIYKPYNKRLYQFLGKKIKEWK